MCPTCRRRCSRFSIGDSSSGDFKSKPEAKEVWPRWAQRRPRAPAAEQGCDCRGYQNSNGSGDDNEAKARHDGVNFESMCNESGPVKKEIEVLSTGFGMSAGVDKVGELHMRGKKE